MCYVDLQRVKSKNKKNQKNQEGKNCYKKREKEKEEIITLRRECKRNIRALKVKIEQQQKYKV